MNKRRQLWSLLTLACKINKRKGSGEVLLHLYSSLREQDYSCYGLVENCRYLNENKVCSRASLVNLTITRGTDALCHWKLFAILMVEKNQLGSSQFSAAFSECLCLCTFSASLGFWEGKQMFRIEIVLDKYEYHRLNVELLSQKTTFTNVRCELKYFTYWSLDWIHYINYHVL